MKRLFSKLGFIHECLWQREGAYRAALLLGPAPLLGAAVAVALWGGVSEFRALTYQPPPWATWSAPNMWSDGATRPQVLQPARPLPDIGADGALVGYQPGWKVSARPIEVSPTMNVDVKTNALTGFVVSDPAIDMAQVIAGGPKDALFIGVGTGLFVVRETGIYTLSVRLERPFGPAVTCLTRLGFGPHRVSSNVTVNIAIGAKDFALVPFDLQPGLYPIAWAFGCWRDQQTTGPGPDDHPHRPPWRTDTATGAPRRFRPLKTPTISARDPADWPARVGGGHHAGLQIGQDRSPDAVVRHRFVELRGSRCAP